MVKYLSGDRNNQAFTELTWSRLVTTREKKVLIISLKHTTVTERKHIVSDLADLGSNHTAFILHWTRIIIHKKIK